MNTVLIALLTAYAIVGLHTGKLYLPKKLGGAAVRGAGIYLLVCAVALGILYLLMDILDHYDKRDNESTYNELRLWFGASAFLLLMLANCSGTPR